MALFQAGEFALELPPDTTDESTYAFALPARSNFRPSVVVKAERIEPPGDLPSYVDRQLEKIAAALPQANVIRSGPARHSKYPAHASLFDWGEPPRRLRQKQYYLLLKDPLRVMTITGTGLQEDFAHVEALFDAVFLSFRPMAPDGKGV